MKFSGNKLLKTGLVCTLTISILMGLTACGNSREAGTSGTGSKANTIDFGLAAQVTDGSILHCFSWSFNTITESMEDIAAAGFSGIQTSPINACYDGGNAGMELFGEGKWSYHYQPTDWKIGNYQLGTRDEFKKMCDVAHSYGIKVIVDVAPNHTTKEISGVSEDLLTAAGGQEALYHSGGMDAISDYTDRKQCTLMGVGGLPDVNTENVKFQDYFISYLNDCIACGADGFRYDTAKHIGLPDDPKDTGVSENNFWSRVIREINHADTIFNYGEVLQDGGERIADYIDTIGAATASSYGSAIRDAAMSGKMDAEKLKDFKVGGSTNVVTWVEFHDNYTGDESTYLLVRNQDIIRGWSIIAARGAGTPLFFSRPYNSSEDNMWGTMNRIGMAGDMLYKDSTVATVNRFRNAMAGEPENIYNLNENTEILYIERGSRGLVIINSGEEIKIGGETTLADGTYINRVDGTAEFVVSGGKITGTLPKDSVVVLYNDGYIEIGKSPLVKVSDDDSQVFHTDTLEVTLVAENTAKAVYSVNGGEEVEFKNGDKLTIGEGVAAGTVIRITLKGESSDGLHSTMTYEFSKKEGTSSGTVIYFKKPDNWKNEICAYVYDETSYSEVKYNEKWPGVAMKEEGNGVYSYTFTEDWIAPLVIFTDGTNQSNGEMEPGEKVESGKTYEVR